MLSELLADLDACDLQKGDTKVLANGEIAPGKSNSFTSLGKRIIHLQIDSVVLKGCHKYVVHNSKLCCVQLLSLSMSFTDKKTAIKNRIKQMMDISRVRCQDND